MLQKIEGIKQSDKFKLYLLTDDNIWDVTKISENFQELEDIISTLPKDDEHIDCLEEKKKLNVVIKELKEANKKVDGKVDKLKIDDEHVDVLSKQKKLNLVLEDLEKKNEQLEKLNTELIELIQTYKEAMDGYFSDLGTETNRHEAANDSLEALL